MILDIHGSAIACKLTRSAMWHQGGKEFKAGIRWLVWSGGLALVSLAGWLAYGLILNKPEDPATVRLITVERSTVETTINASGTLELDGQQTLKSPAEGAVDQVLVQPGDRVQRGQVLLTLRNPERQTALADQELKINQQQVALFRSRQQIAEAQEELVVEQQRLENLTALSQQGAFPQTEVQDQANRVRQIQTALRTAEADAKTAALELEILRLQSQQIQQQLDDTVVTAPLDGVVLGVSVKDGDGVELRTDLLTLGNPTEELVQLQLSTLDAARVRLNQLVRVSVIGPEPQIYPGQIVSLYPQAVVASSQEEGGSSSSEFGQATVPTTVRLDRPTQTLIPGSQVNVEIVLEQEQNVVALNIEAIQQAETEPFVWVLDSAGKVQRRPVQLGLEGLTEVEIVSGLQGGDRVVLPPPDLVLEPGMPVVPEAVPEAMPEAVSEGKS